MRMHFSRKDVAQHAPVHAEREQSQEQRFSPNHCWISRKSPAEVRVGIEPTLASLLSPKEIVLPFVGDVVTLDQYCCWVITEGGTLHIASPVSGTVTAVNASITSDPFLLSNSSLVNGWLYEVRMRADLAAEPALLAKAEADERFRADHDRFTGLVREALGHQKSRVGATLADGGVMLRDVAAMLGPKRYFELIDAVYGSGDSAQ
jgi:glycine cleavage system H lipoate-binding protein